MFTRLKDFLIGPPIPTQNLGGKRLNKIRALAAFSPDALSTIAYANQEIYLVLLIAGSTGLFLSWPIGIAITGLLIIVALSYYQTIYGYPSGGGSYVVARENLGTVFGLIADCGSQSDGRSGGNCFGYPVSLAASRSNRTYLTGLDHACQPARVTGN